MRVRVAFVNGGCETETHVRLVGHYGVVAEGTANDQCVVDFTGIPVGTYHVIASGHNFPDTDSGDIAMDSTQPPIYEVKVNRTRDPLNTRDVGMALMISTPELATPPRARKEFAKASELLAKQDFTHAIERFNKAIAIYPDYAGAYNSLGVIYSRLGDNTQAAAAFRKAIDINDRFALAYMNLGLLNLAQGDFPNAESVLNKASVFDPANITTLTALSYAEFMDHNLGEAIVASQRAHALPGEHSFVHQVAARAYEQKHEVGSAIEELELFLKEEPTGSQADIARKELTAVRAIPH
jgi:tetratricopeptide (TPR) repeat protein